MCHSLYRDDSAEPMVQCDGCEVWVHTQCDGISDEDYAAIGDSGQVPVTAWPRLCQRCVDLTALLGQSWCRRLFPSNITARPAAKAAT